MYLIKEHIKDINIEELDDFQRVMIDECIYNKKEIIEIKQVIDFIIESCPKIINESNRDKEIFTYVYVLLANLIHYDLDAEKYLGLGGYYREMSQPYVDNITGLYGLVSRKAICSGYSRILKEVLYYFGINCKIVISNQGTKDTGHSWNQVFIDGRWYNCDLTNDVYFILNGLNCLHFLKSDSDFDRLTVYPNLKTSKEKCDVTISDEEQRQLINHYNDYVRKILSLNNEKVIARNFIDKLRQFFDEKISSGRRKR